MEKKRIQFTAGENANPSKEKQRHRVIGNLFFIVDELAWYHNSQKKCELTAFFFLFLSDCQANFDGCKVILLFYFIFFAELLFACKYFFFF